jgi:hypothetical protein
MDVTDVPEALEGRLGREGAHGLVVLLNKARADWKDDVVTTAMDHFDRRLTADVSALRVDFTREMSTLRQDVTHEISTLRQDVTHEISTLRQDVTREISTLRQDVTRDVSGVRVELLKWSFLFWIGQVAAMAGLLAFMLE